MNKLVFASVISEIQQSDIFMSVKARICEAPAANLNGARVTEAFIDEIVDNPDRYVGLPLYADVRALTNGNYRRLGHLYDSKTGEFHSTQIGSFYQFEKEEFDGGCYLVGYARIAKRNRKLSKAISELFADGALKFSFEVAVGEYEELDDDTILIDASESNYLEGTAIVTFPACEDAVALELVAQQQKADDPKGGVKEMADNKTVAEEVAQPVEVAEEETEVVAEEAQAETPSTPEAPVVAEEATETAEETAEQTDENQTETAAVVMHETHRTTDSVYAYDTESGVDVMQRVDMETTVSHVEPEAQIVEADDGVHIAEDEGAEGTEPETSEQETSEESGESGEEPAEERAETPEPAADETLPVVEDTKKTAEQNALAQIAELTAAIEILRKEIAELKETKVVAESKNVIGEINPIMDNINTPGRYSLLEKEEKPHSYSLLSR